MLAERCSTGEAGSIDRLIDWGIAIGVEFEPPIASHSQTHRSSCLACRAPLRIQVRTLIRSTNRAENHPRIGPKSSENPSKIGPWGARAAIGGPKTPTSAPRDAPRRPKNAQKAAWEGPEAANERPQSAKRSVGQLEKGPQESQDRSKVASERSRNRLFDRPGCEPYLKAMFARLSIDFAAENRLRLERQVRAQRASKAKSSSATTKRADLQKV